MTLRRPAATGAGHRGHHHAGLRVSQRRARRATASSPSPSPTPRGGARCCPGAEMDEARSARRSARASSRERDPDVLEGHNIFRFDLEYLEARARRHRVTLGWGRDGSRAARPSLAHAGRRAHHRLPALRGGGAAHRGHLDARATLRRGRPRPRLLRAQGRGPALRRRRPRPDVSPRRGHPPHLPRGPGAADGLRARRRAGDARPFGHPVAAVLRPGAGLALRLPVGGASGQRDQDRRAPPPRVPASRSGGAPRPARAARSAGGYTAVYQQGVAATCCTWTSPRSTRRSC